MVRSRFLLSSISLLSVSVFAQCPRINFQGPGQQMMVNALHKATRFSGLQRVADGSFTQHIFTGDIATQQNSKIGTVLHDEQNFLACVGLGSRTRHPGPSHISTDPLGTTAITAIATDLNGSGLGSFAFLTPYAPKDNIAVGLLDSDITGGTVTFYKVGRSPQNMVAADFNNDGKHDVAVVYSGPGDGVTPGGVSVLLGNGDGTLRAAVNYPAGNYTTSATVFDLNGDGKIDLAVTNFNDNDVQVLLGNGDGTFQAPVAYMLPIRFQGIPGFPTSVAAADVNGDGHPDLIAGTVNGIAILYGKGDGTFTAGPLLNASVISSLVAAGDFNKDGRVDLAISDFRTGALYTFLNAGGGNFSNPTVYGFPLSAVPTGDANPGNFFVEDFDGDGNPDIVFASGHPDGLVPNYQNLNISVLYGNGDGSFAATRYFVPSHSPTNPVVADFNGDGKPDYAAATSGPDIVVSLGNGDGTFQSTLTTTVPDMFFSSIAAADLNQDGKADILAAASYTGIEVLLSKGDGTFASPQTITGVNNPVAVATGDFNHDGKPDMAVIDSNTQIAIFLGSGNGAFGAPVIAAMGTKLRFLQTGDVNHDGITDILAVDSGIYGDNTSPGGILVLIGKGDGTFQSPVNYPVSLNPDAVQIGDFNGDGKPDLIVASDTDSTLTVLTGNGDGSFQKGSITGTDFNPEAVAVGDFDGDGKQDLLVGHCCGFAWTTYLIGNGDGTFQSEAAFSFLSIRTMTTADFNGDNKPDVVFTTHGSNGDGVGTYFNVPSRQLATVSAAAYKAPPVAPDSIVTSFGLNLATTTGIADVGTDPLTLAGTSIEVQDSTGAKYPAGLFFANGTQVNFLMPAQTAAGTATLTVTSGDGTKSSGTVEIAPVAPSIFTLNAGNLAAAIPVLYHADGSPPTVSQIFSVDQSGGIVAAPIDLGSPTDSLYLFVYGTGIRGASAQNITAIAGGVTLQVTGAAATSQYPGEDQVNVLLPRSLIGAGNVTLMLTVNGIKANPVTLSIK